MYNENIFETGFKEKTHKSPAAIAARGNRQDGDYMTSIRDVARIAGVSPSTVSRVMNDTARVDDEKRQKVERAIIETGFKPNEVARSLYKRSSRIIGILVPDIINPFFNEMAEAIEEECDRRGYRLTLCSSNNDLEKEKRNLNLLERMNADGVILMTNREEIQEEIEKCGIPVVMIDRQVEGGKEIACVQSNHYQGGRISTEHLLECGCRRIIQMSGSLRLSSARQRHQGYMDVCRERGIEPAWIEGEYSYESGISMARQLMARYPDADGIIAANDMVAISVYKELHKNGLRVPEDIQMIGFDNISLSSLVTPEITTIAQPIGDMGREAVRILTDYVAGVRNSQRKVFGVRLIKRDTTIEHQGDNIE